MLAQMTISHFLQPTFCSGIRPWDCQITRSSQMILILYPLVQGSTWQVCSWMLGEEDKTLSTIFGNFGGKTIYLTALKEKQTSDLRKMKPTTSQQPHIGDVVQVYDETFRGSWKVGRITRVLRSRDGKVRAAEVQLANGHIIDRAISKLYPLESSTPPTTEKPESERRQSTRLAAIRAGERLASPSLY